ncbi:hypothetical protein TrCOL_g5322 [Triparma columacea]|uniref:BZIP domain-containing protein n=1 Tax=Triparma columacea TaxID=722753 RepID=A0A9W7FZJ6_9STRA|nr:hypothetical protein TrCOL_g5322 [Triparma columacea]
MPVKHKPSSNATKQHGVTMGVTMKDTDLKKMQKRAANRKSAQLSRKRKKQYIEELQEQNMDLKKRVHILRHVPDLVVVFNVDSPPLSLPPQDPASPGAPEIAPRPLPEPNSIDFASDAALALLSATPSDMEGRSIWDFFTLSSSHQLKQGLSEILDFHVHRLGGGQSGYSNGSYASTPPPSHLPAASSPGPEQKKSNLRNLAPPTSGLRSSADKQPPRQPGGGGNMTQLQQLRQLREEGLQVRPATVTSFPLPSVYRLELISPFAQHSSSTTSSTALPHKVEVHGVCSVTPGERPQCILSIRLQIPPPTAPLQVSTATKIPTGSTTSSSSYSSGSSTYSTTTGATPPAPPFNSAALPSSKPPPSNDPRKGHGGLVLQNQTNETAVSISNSSTNSSDDEELA